MLQSPHLADIVDMRAADGGLGPLLYDRLA
jgi:hypothetical protein